MKKSFFIVLTFLFFFSSCEKVVEIDLPSTEPILIIDAPFEINFDNNPVTAKTVVKLRLSADYFEENIPIVTNADVFVTNLTTNEIILFNDDDLDGDYVPNSQFIPEENIEYELTVAYENQIYKGKATRVKSTPLTSVVQGNTTLFSGEETELIVYFSDNANEENYYLFDFDNNFYLTVEDRFFNGADYNFSYFYGEDDIELPTTVTVKMSGISRDYYTYFRVLLDQSGEGGGGPFETIPATLLGNMINTTERENFPLGYFHISETDSVTLSLVELE